MIKTFLTWLFQDFLYHIYDLLESKYTLAVSTLVATKSFSPSTIAPGGTSLMTITLTQVNYPACTAVAFTDTYPAGMTNATPPAVNNFMGGTPVAASAGGSLSLTGGVLPDSTGVTTVTTISVYVTASTLGTYNNSTGAITLAIGGPVTAATATPTVAMYIQPTIPLGFIGQNYVFQFQASGGTAPYTYAVTSGSIGFLTLSSTGLLSGATLTQTALSFSVTVTDSAAHTRTQAYTTNFLPRVSTADCEL